MQQWKANTQGRASAWMPGTAPARAVIGLGQLHAAAGLIQRVSSSALSVGLQGGRVHVPR